MVDGYLAHYRIVHPREKTHREALEWANHAGSALGARSLAVRAGPRGPARVKLEDKGRQVRQVTICCPCLLRVHAPVQESRRIERRRALADFEMQLRGG